MPIITLFCAFSRDSYTKGWLECLDSLVHDPSRTHLVFIIDGDFFITASQLRTHTDRKGYASVTIQMNRDHNPNDVKIAVRRNRIAFIHNQSKGLIRKRPSEFVLGLEDDTDFRGLDIARLLHPFENDDKCGFVEGVQCGRWRCKYIGAWQTENPSDPTRVQSVIPREFSGYQMIDAGGFYYFLTPTKLYLEHDFVWNSESWGPDVNYGLWLRGLGYNCYVDWESITGHRTYDRTVYPDGTLTEVSYERDESGNWSRHDRDQPSTYRAA